MKVNVALDPSYDVHIAPGLLNQVAEFCQPLAQRIALIADETVAELYGEQVLQQLHAADLFAELFTFPAGEDNKSRASKAAIEDAMFERGFGRDSLVLALGGGVTCDLAGFIAATFCRGVPAIYCPTTLLAMVDACVGGKTAINIPQGKNLIGCFSQPKAVLMDVTTLQTLNPHEYRQGLAEMAKHALLAGGDFYHSFKQASNDLVAQDIASLQQHIAKHVAFKADVVAKDEKEQGLRQILNLGHTIAHGIEKVSQHRIAHGDAVAKGLYLEAKLASEQGIASTDLADDIKQLLQGLGFDITLAGLDEAEVLANTKQDKKSIANQARFVLLQAIGEVYQAETGAFATALKIN